LSSFSFYLDVFTKELFKSGRVKNSILGRLGNIDGVLYNRSFGSRGPGLKRSRCKPTEKGTQQSDTEELTMAKVLEDRV